MVEFTATELQAKTGFVIERALREPVRITRNKRFVAVMLSSDEFEKLRAIEDSYWGEAAKIAVLSGSVEDDKIQKLLERLQ